MAQEQIAPCAGCGRTPGEHKSGAAHMDDSGCMAYVPSADPRSSTGPGNIGAQVWPGLHKLVEECAEVQQVCMKLLAFPDGVIPDSEEDVPLPERLALEMGDLFGALNFVMDVNPQLDPLVIQRQAEAKRQRFHVWHGSSVA